MPRKLTCLLALLSASACTPLPSATVAVPGTLDAEKALLSSISDVDKAATTLSPPLPAAANAAPQDLNRAIEYSAKGSLDDVARALATSVGYRFATNATNATKPVPVELDAKNMPVIDLLRSVGMQAGARADVVVRSEDRVVEIRYHA